MASRNKAPAKGNLFSAIVMLAFWQVSQVWRLLVACGVGILVATVLVCTVPLYSQVALSAGLHAALNAASTTSSINIVGTLNGTSDPNAIDTISQQIAQTMQSDIAGNVVATQPQSVVQMAATPILSPNYSSPQFQARLASGQTPTEGFASLPQIQLVGLDQDQLSSHVHLLQGRLPRSSRGVIEVALLPSIAHCLFLYTPASSRSAASRCFSVSVGDEFTIISPFIAMKSGAGGEPQFVRSTAILRVVGLFTPINEVDPFWHGNTFGTTTSSSGSSLITGLTTAEALTSALSQAVQNAHSYVELNSSATLSWYYPLKVARIDATNLSSLTSELSNFTTDIGNIGGGRFGPLDAQFTASAPIDTLSEFGSRAAQAQAPIAMLLLFLVGMVVLFISITTELLVERQTTAIALLHSRGASRRQVFGAFATQMIALGLLALVAGPLLAIPLSVLLAQHLFSSLDTSAVALVTAQPLASIWNIRWYALFAVGLSLLCTLLTLHQTTRLDMLALRREASRPTRAPFWQRFYLDALCLVLALLAYSYALYSLNTGTLDPATGAQVLAPLVMMASALFLLAGLLLLLRFFPQFIQLIGKLAARRSGAASMIALSQIARTPRQAVRTILLLTLTTAFAIFSLVFSASQAQRITDMVNYQVGADFSAQLPGNTAPTRGQPATSFTVASLATETASYQAIPGVLSATLGMMEPAQIGNTSLTIKAVDARTFARTALWTTQDSTQPLNELMAQLIVSRKLAQDEQVVPAIVDAETWNTLHLSPGQRFTLGLATIGAAGAQIPFLALTEVRHIPTMISNEGGDLSSQGVLVDDQSFSTVFTKVTNQPPLINYVWLHTRTDQNSLNSVRAALARRIPNTGSLTILDRLAFIATVQQDPLVHNLAGVLAIGALTPLILALLGSLLLSWMSARERLLNFAVLRALGSSPGQLMGVLSWEQGVVYALMLTLGVLYGVLLSIMALPSLILTSIVLPGGSSAFSFQSDLPAIQIVIPPLLILVLALLLAVCVLALGLMARVVSRPSISQTLRLNAD
ncbi:MAG TPA: FtsX-like permease family protein [Ktedonobacteraceae bacterium]|nr:FtsX-like permease family protein [Ktedonobacteraceae bacterium]